MPPADSVARERPRSLHVSWGQGSGAGRSLSDENGLVLLPSVRWLEKGLHTRGGSQVRGSCLGRRWGHPSPWEDGMGACVLPSRSPEAVGTQGAWPPPCRVLRPSGSFAFFFLPHVNGQGLRLRFREDRIPHIQRPSNLGQRPRRREAGALPGRHVSAASSGPGSAQSCELASRDSQNLVLFAH